MDRSNHMRSIPTEPVWDIFGRDHSGDIKYAERLKKLEAAIERLKELEMSGGNELSYSIMESLSIIPDRTMPTEEQKRALCGLMHRAFVTLRNLGYAKKPDAIADLADVFHNLPDEMFREEAWDWNQFEAALLDFEEKYPEDKIYPFAALLREIRAKS